MFNNSRLSLQALSPFVIAAETASRRRGSQGNEGEAIKQGNPERLLRRYAPRNDGGKVFRNDGGKVFRNDGGKVFHNDGGKVFRNERW